MSDKAACSYLYDLLSQVVTYSEVPQLKTDWVILDSLGNTFYDENRAFWHVGTKKMPDDEIPIRIVLAERRDTIISAMRRAQTKTLTSLHFDTYRNMALLERILQQVPSLRILETLYGICYLSLGGIQKLTIRFENRHYMQVSPFNYFSAPHLTQLNYCMGETNDKEVSELLMHVNSTLTSFYCHTNIREDGNEMYNNIAKCLKLRHLALHETRRTESLDERIEKICTSIRPLVDLETFEINYVFHSSVNLENSTLHYRSSQIFSAVNGLIKLKRFKWLEPQLAANQSRSMALKGLTQLVSHRSLNYIEIWPMKFTEYGYLPLPRIDRSLLTACYLNQRSHGQILDRHCLAVRNQLTRWCPIAFGMVFCRANRHSWLRDSFLSIWKANTARFLCFDCYDPTLRDEFHEFPSDYFTSEDTILHPRKRKPV